MRWLGIEISDMHITSLGMIFPYMCVSLYAALIWKSYKKLYESEITVKLKCYKAGFHKKTCIMKKPGLTYKQEIYQPEITIKLRVHIISVVVFACIIIFTITILSVVRHNLNKATLKYLDYHINYITENNLLNIYAETDDMVQMITSNPYIGKKQTNGADALWEYCSYNTEERKEEFVSRIRKTSEMLEFREEAET